MKKTVNYFMLRFIFALLLGLVLILWPAIALEVLVITIGALFIIPGLISLIGYLARDRGKHPDMAFPFTGLGCLLFGIVLVVMPEFFVKVLMYILGAILVLGGVEQIVTLVRARKHATVRAVFYVAPVLILLAGILVLFNPFKTAETVFVVIGVTCLVYGLAEMVNWLKFSKKHDSVGYLPAD